MPGLSSIVTLLGVLAIVANPTAAKPVKHAKDFPFKSGSKGDVCPEADGKKYTFHNTTFGVLCGWDTKARGHNWGPYFHLNFAECVDKCAKKKDCSIATYTGTCYLKKNAKGKGFVTGKSPKNQMAIKLHSTKDKNDVHKKGKDKDHKKGKDKNHKKGKDKDHKKGKDEDHQKGKDKDGKHGDHKKGKHDDHMHEHRTQVDDDDEKHHRTGAVNVNPHAKTKSHSKSHHKTKVNHGHDSKKHHATKLHKYTTHKTHKTTKTHKISHTTLPTMS